MMRRGSFIAGVIVVAAVLTGCSGGGGGEKKVLLEASNTAGPAAFTTSVAYTVVSSTAPATTVPATAAPAGGVRKVSGVAPGLYGGTQNSASCDVEQMVSFLTSPANADKAAAWAEVQGISTAQIPDYLRSLTPVVLREDTRVTNHGFAGGKATPRQAVLQAGTAVLVDKTGIPRAKCACGNPLLPPVNPEAKATYKGTPWTGFQSSAVAAVQPGPPVQSFTLVDSATGQSFTRPVGGNGSTDSAAAGGGREQDRVYTGGPNDSLPAIDVDVPFVVSSTDAVRGGGVSGYFVGANSSTLQHAGHYADFVVEDRNGGTWRVVVRPLGPKLHAFTGTGDTDLGSPSVPAEAVVELQGTGSAGSFYLGSDAGVLSSFTALPSDQLKGLKVTDQNRVGWTLDLWGLPPGCGYDTGTTQSVKCSS